jgi:hypothetical protein
VRGLSFAIVVDAQETDGSLVPPRQRFTCSETFRLRFGIEFTVTVKAEAPVNFTAAATTRRPMFSAPLSSQASINSVYVGSRRFSGSSCDRQTRFDHL